MKKRNVPNKYQQHQNPFQYKKLQKEVTREFRRELGIKAGYKKLLKKENVADTPKNFEGRQDKYGRLNPEKRSPSKEHRTVATDDGWSISENLEKSEAVKPTEATGWTVTKLPKAERKGLKPSNKEDWAVSHVEPPKRKINRPKPAGWTILTDSDDTPKKQDKYDTLTTSHIDNKRRPQGSSSHNHNQTPKFSQNKNKKQLEPENQRGKPSTAFGKAKNIFARKEQERADKAASFKKRAEEREEAIKNRKRKRLEKFKVLNQKTSKGQPVMKGRMQLLLQKIQSSMK